MANFGHLEDVARKLANFDQAVKDKGVEAFAGFPEDDLFGFEGDDLDGFDDFDGPEPAGPEPAGRRISVDAPGFGDEPDAATEHATPGFAEVNGSPPRTLSAHAGFGNNLGADDALAFSRREGSFRGFGDDKTAKGEDTDAQATLEQVDNAPGTLPAEEATPTATGNDTETETAGFDDGTSSDAPMASASGARPARRLTIEVEEGIERAMRNSNLNAQASYMPLEEVDSDDDGETSGGYSFGNPEPGSEDEGDAAAGPPAAAATREINGVPVGCTPDPAWLHGELSRQQAEQLLSMRGATKGAFLVRALEIKTVKDAPLALSVIFGGKTKHHNITVAPDGGLCVGKFAPMPRPGGSKNLADLVEFLSLAFIGGHSDECAEKAPKWPVRLTTGVNTSGQRLPELWTKPGAAGATKVKAGKNLKVTWVDEENAATEDREFLDISVIPRHVVYGRYLSDGTEEMPSGGIYNLPDDNINDETLSMYYESLLEGVPYQTLGDFGPDVAGWSEGDLVFSANEIINVWDEGAPDTGFPSEDKTNWLVGWTQDGKEGNLPATFARRIAMKAAPMALEKYGS